MNKRPIIIDTDPGIDDAVAIAIALFSDELDVRLITTVAGNVSLDKVTYNTLRLLKFYGKEVPVAKGAEAPLIRPLQDASNVHGKSGMEGFDFEEPDEHLLLKENAVEAMYRVIMESPEPITLVPIAPLTNIALLLKVYPEVKERIRESAIAYLLKPEMYEVAETCVDIELNGSMTAGCTLVDLKGYLGKPNNAKVCMDIDQEMFRTWFLDCIAKCV